MRGTERIDRDCEKGEGGGQRKRKRESGKEHRLRR